METVNCDFRKYLRKRLAKIIRLNVITWLHILLIRRRLKITKKAKIIPI